MPEPALAAVSPRQDLQPSPALSIIANGPQSMAGRKLGILVSDDTDAELYAALAEAATREGAVYEVVAPRIGGVTLSDGSMLAAKHKIDGGPSVLFDAVAIIPSVEEASLLSADKPSQDFASDAFAHCKFIGLSEGGRLLMDAVGLAEKLDEGCLPLAEPGDAAAFLKACAPLRLWTRELAVDLDARI
jgi:catalase